MVEKRELIVEVYTAWWWDFIYWPLTCLGLGLGFELNEEIIERDFSRSVKTKIVKDKEQTVDKSVLLYVGK